jgi:3-phosphoshikimate 1-carboxyvinyltransferase
MDGFVMSFLGPIPASKSMLNRALIIQSYFPDLKLLGDSDCDDVRYMRSGLQQLTRGETVDCGEGGTTFRFLALRASRIPGTHKLIGTERLFSRPQDELNRIFLQLGVEVVWGKSELTVRSSGWKPQGDTLYVPSHRSSQFVSGVLLNAWDLPYELFVSPMGAGISEGYWKMTQAMAGSLGMRIDKWDHDFRIPIGQKVLATELALEPDMSSAFSLAACAAVGGSATLLDFPVKSLQPDFAFVEILQKMNVPVQVADAKLKVQKSPELQAVAVKLTSAPDLFPVLAVLCALAKGDSDLYGAPQLVHKESNRIQKISELLQVTGRTMQISDDGLKISGERKASGRLSYDPDHDHRLAMAAAVLQLAGYDIEIKNRDVTGKSFPGFWQAVGL